MKRRVGLVLALLVVVVAGGAMALAVVEGIGIGGSAYTVAQIQAEADRLGTQLNGRTVRVRASVWHSSMSGTGAGSNRWIFTLTDGADAPDTDPQIKVAIGPQDRWLTRLRQLPGLGSLLPPPQGVAMNTEETYRLRLSVITDLAVCTPSRPCIHAELLDAVQPSVPLPSTMPGDAAFQ